MDNNEKPLIFDDVNERPLSFGIIVFALMCLMIAIIILFAQYAPNINMFLYNISPYTILILILSPLLLLFLSDDKKMMITEIFSPFIMQILGVNKKKNNESKQEH